LDFAVGDDNFSQVVPSDLLGLNRDNDLALSENCARRQGNQRNADDRENENLPAFLRVCHLDYLLRHIWPRFVSVWNQIVTQL
jgi:hypothetical protein